MMREILFRGKRTANGVFVEGFLFLKQEGEETLTCIGIDPLRDYPDGELAQGCYFEVRPETIGQYTGLTDKNGTKIFEGDICRVSRPCVLAYGKITFQNGCFWFVDDGPGGMLRLCDVKMNGFEVEVIGSTHDNPELLEEN